MKKRSRSPASRCYDLDRCFRHALIDPFGAIITDMRKPPAVRERERGEKLAIVALLRRREIARRIAFNQKHPPGEQAYQNDEP